MRFYLLPNSHLLLPSPEFYLSLRIWRASDIVVYVLRPPFNPSLSFQVTLESELPSLQQFNQHHLDLVARKESSRTSMISMTEVQGFRGRGYVLVLVFVAGIFAKIVVAEAIELACGLGGWILRWIEGRCSSRTMDGPSCKSKSCTFGKCMAS